MDNFSIKETIDTLRVDLLNLIDSRLDSIANRLSSVDDADADTKPNGHGDHVRRYVVDNRTEIYRNGSTDGKKSSSFALQEKQFSSRNSLLTDLFESIHIRTIYHMFVAVLIMLILGSMLHELLDTGRINLEFEMIRWCFGGFPIVITMWIAMFGSTILILYPVYRHWAEYPLTTGRLDYLYLLIYIAYLTAFIVLPIKYILHYDLPIASTLIIACEQVRFIMKVHAYVRENVAKVVRYRSFESKNPRKTQTKDEKTEGDSSDKDDIVLRAVQPRPDFGKFLYFLFAPTLIYRDVYPRTVETDWTYVATNFAQVLGCTFYVYYVFSHFCVPIFQNFNKDHISPRTFVLAVFNSVLPGALCFFLGFFAVLHSWLNAFAEMLRFADRMFYQDWWNSTSLAGYYRTWNVVVHDWLYTHVYRDLCLLLGQNHRTTATVGVFFISALVHEYIISIAFRFFYPVLFMEFFCIGVGLMFVTRSNQRRRSWNVMLWVSLFLGTGLLMCLYSMEWYARINCQLAYDNFLDYLTPRSWTCTTTAHELVTKLATLTA